MERSPKWLCHSIYKSSRILCSWPLASQRFGKWLGRFISTLLELQSQKTKLYKESALTEEKKSWVSDQRIRRFYKRCHQPQDIPSKTFRISTPNPPPSPRLAEPPQKNMFLENSISDQTQLPCRKKQRKALVKRAMPYRWLNMLCVVLRCWRNMKWFIESEKKPWNKTKLRKHHIEIEKQNKNMKKNNRNKTWPKKKKKDVRFPFPAPPCAERALLLKVLIPSVNWASQLCS